MYEQIKCVKKVYMNNRTGKWKYIWMDEWEKEKKAYMNERIVKRKHIWIKQRRKEPTDEWQRRKKHIWINKRWKQSIYE